MLLQFIANGLITGILYSLLLIVGLVLNAIHADETRVKSMRRNAFYSDILFFFGVSTLFELC